MLDYPRLHRMVLPCVVYDKNCVGSKSYFELAEEFMKNSSIESAA